MRSWSVLVLLLCLFTSNAQLATIDEVNGFIGRKQYVKAQEFLLEKLEFTPYPVLKDKLGEVYSYQSKWNEAIQVYKELTMVYPQNAEYQFRYGGVLAKKAQSGSKLGALTLIGRMKESFGAAAEMDARHIGTRWALVDIYVSLPGILGGSMSKAYTSAGELMSISPIDGYFALGYVYEYDDEPRNAKINYLKALKHLNNVEKVERNQLNYQIGKVCGDYGLQLEKGIYHMQQYIDRFSVKDGVPLPWAYYRMAKLYRHLGNKYKAEAWIQKALHDRPEFKQAIKEQLIIKAL